MWKLKNKRERALNDNVEKPEKAEIVYFTPFFVTVRVLITK